MYDDIRRTVSESLNALARKATRDAHERGGTAEAADRIGGWHITAVAVPTTRQQRNAQDRFGLAVEWKREGEAVKRKELLNDITRELANTF